MELSTQRTQPLLYLCMMHKKWFFNGVGDYQVYHRDFTGLLVCRRNFRTRCTDSIESVVLIALPFAVETHIYDNNNIMWSTMPYRRTTTSLI